MLLDEVDVTTEVRFGVDPDGRVWLLRCACGQHHERGTVELTATDAVRCTRCGARLWCVTRHWVRAVGAPRRVLTPARVTSADLLRSCHECGYLLRIEPGTLYCRRCGARLVRADEADALWLLAGGVEHEPTTATQVEQRTS